MAIASDTQIRLLRPGDAAQVADLLAAAFAEEFAGEPADGHGLIRMLRAGGWVQRGPWRRLAGSITGSFAFLVAVQRGRVVGCTGLMGAGPPVIHSVAVHPAFRRQGVAAALVREAERLAALAGHDRVTLDVLAHNTPALTLYRRLDYEEFHRFRTYTHRCIPAPRGGGLPPGARLARMSSAGAQQFEALRAASLPPRLLAVAPPHWSRYGGGPPAPLVRLAGGGVRIGRVVLEDGEPAGILGARVAPGAVEGRIFLPLLPPDATPLLAPALDELRRAFARAGARRARLELSDSRAGQHTAVEAAGWSHQWTFVQMTRLLAL